MTESITRKSFIAASTIGTTALAVNCINQAHAEEQQDETTWAEEADFVIIGLGAAGLGAAKDALDLGMTVTILEAAPESQAGGSLRCNGGNWAYITPLCYTNCSFGAIGQELADQMYEESYDYADWLEEVGVEWSPLMASDNKNVVMVTADGWGYAIWEAARQAVEAEGASVHYSTPAIRVITDASGQAIGVEAKTEEGTSNFKAKKGVLIATGGYASNEELIQGNHFACLPYASCTSPYCDGSGITMAAKAGGKVMQDVSLCVEFFGWAFKRASDEMGTAMIAQEPMFRNGDFSLERIFINGKGKRFMREDYATVHDKSTSMPFLYYDNIKDNAKGGTNIGNGYVNLPMWAVFGQSVLDAGCLLVNDDWTWGRTQGVYEWSQDNQAEVERGWIYKADTIEELASFMKSTNSTNGEPVEVDPQELAATIKDYNENICATGIDPLGKNEKYLKPIEGPFYAVEMVPAIGYTNNGVSVNESSQVLDWDNQPIPRLYAAGDISSQMRAYLLGMNGCWVRGAIAARHANELSAWDE